MQQSFGKIVFLLRKAIDKAIGGRRTKALWNNGLNVDRQHFAGEDGVGKFCFGFIENGLLVEVAR